LRLILLEFSESQAEKPEQFGRDSAAVWNFPPPCRFTKSYSAGCALPQCNLRRLMELSAKERID
jgi:hypothetical protein